MPTGVLEPAGVEDWAFQQQYHTFANFGYAHDDQGKVVGNESGPWRVHSALQAAVKGKKEDTKKQGGGEEVLPDAQMSAFTGSDKQLRRQLKKRRKRERALQEIKKRAREAAEDHGDGEEGGGASEAKGEGKTIEEELYGGPQTDFEKGTITEEQLKFRQEWEAAQKLKHKEYDMDEDHDRRDERKISHLMPPRHDRHTTAPDSSTKFHGRQEVDYQGRSWVKPPRGHKAGDGTHKAFPPKRCIHRWTGHTKGVNHIEFFPGHGHLLLSCSMDAKIKIWDVLEDRQVKRTYQGHSMGVRDVRFNADGSQFLSCAFDRFIRLWDTETGQVLGTFTNRKVPYCVRYYPVDENIFLVGSSCNKVVQWDARANEIVQEYNHHLGPVNTVLFAEDNRRFVSTSDDKKILIWEYNIPVPIKYISEPSMHSMPTTTLHPSGNFFAGQSMNNEIHVYAARDRFKFMRKKLFKGHVNAGYANRISFSPNGKYICCGDAEGKFFVWDWGSRRIYKKFLAHENNPVTSCDWHPVESSWVATCGWDGVIKLWD